MTKAEALQLNTWVYLNRGGSIKHRRLLARWREICLVFLAVFALVWFRYDRQAAVAGASTQADGLPVLSQAAAIAVGKPAEPVPVVQTASIKLPSDTSSPAGSAAQQPGTARNGYAFGNCTYYVATRRAVPNNWGNARSWYGNAQRAGYHVDTIPVEGAIAWIPLGYFGHVAIVEKVSGNQVFISEMNYKGWNRISQRWASISDFKYIY
ncbi:MAG TPA: CHAP domain-containing protein [Candidatus Nanoarchaeia archaeon]|nr:CHAP domain-containing protein [Candidatus Nanoarchaeia archaeon]